MEYEYGSAFCNRFIAPMRARHQRHLRQDVRRSARDQKEKQKAEHFRDVELAWPETVPFERKLECARQYMEGSKWPKTFVCSVCSRELERGEPLSVSRYDEEALKEIISSMHFELLCVTENDRRNDVDVIDHPLLWGYLLDPR